MATTSGYVAPRELYGFLTGARPGGDEGEGKPVPSPPELLTLLERHLPLYLQMVGSDQDGPGSQTQFDVFAALRELGIVSARPLLLAIADCDEADEGALDLLRLVVRRLVVSNIATGSIEKRFGLSDE